MKFTTTTALLCFTSWASINHAAPIYRRDVYVPPIISPKGGEIWAIGEKQLVTWDVKQHPTQITNKKGKIQLRKGELTLDNVTLAVIPDILEGQVEVTVPDVTPGDDYRVVLFGDSGNWSPQFSIRASNCSHENSEASPQPASSIFSLFEPFLSRLSTRIHIIIEQL